MNIKALFASALLGIAAAAWADSPIVRELKDGWRFKQVRLTNWYNATVPGTVHTDLLDNRIIEDPFYRLNERGLQWIDKEDWVYETGFTLDADMASRSNIELCLNGLDTYADVYLNDSLIIRSDNMFRRWTAPVSKLIRRNGENTLRVYFHSPVKIDMPKYDALPFHYHASNDQSENGGLLDKKISVFARKAGYHYGWDWGPRLVTMGIWRPVFLRAWDEVCLRDAYYEQRSVDAHKADIMNHVELTASEEDIGMVTVRTIDAGSGHTLAQVTTKLNKGENRMELPILIRSPRLWWTNGLGTPHLYTFTTEVVRDGKVVDSRSDRIGLRSLRIVRDEDPDGRTFYVELNGHPLFAKGANYIPQDIFLPRVTEEDYRRTIQDAVDVNMNMLRVWGGGIYENDLFYDLCDSTGILVWQDFMFACSMYPAEGSLLENIRMEAIDNVRRLRNHACIALWCGNNECQDAWYGWGWRGEIEGQNPEYARRIEQQYHQQYHVTLPEVVGEYAPGTFYWPSSPYAFEGEVSGKTHGDRHYWDVWHARKPFSNYNTEKGRFFSEYGFQSFPEFASVRRYAPDSTDWDIRSEVMMAHQRGGEHANGLIETYLTDGYPIPKDFQSFLYTNLVMQGDAIRTAMEAHRRMKPYNMGSLVWQHNDCWPVASWSSRDYYGRWKAQHYFTRHAFDDILVSPVREGDSLNVYIVSDRLRPTGGKLRVRTVELTGTAVYDRTFTVKVQANESRCAACIPVHDLLNGKDSTQVAILLDYDDKGKRRYSNNFALAKQKELDYPDARIATDIQPVEGGYRVGLCCPVFARAVYLSTSDDNSTYSDNYFDLRPDEQAYVTVRTALGLEEFRNTLRTVCLNDCRARFCIPHPMLSRLHCQNVAMEANCR